MGRAIDAPPPEGLAASLLTRHAPRFSRRVARQAGARRFAFGSIVFIICLIQNKRTLN
jgi:hypothetical protein